MRPRALAPLALSLALASCAGPSRARAWEPTPHSRYERLGEAELGRVFAARRLIERGELDEARAVLAEVAAREPENIPLAALLQEVELDLGLPRAELAQRARDRAEREGSSAALLLAARLEENEVEARAWIERALAADPGNAWAHYALAHAEARSGSWGEAEEHLSRALAIDPGHLAARRLEAGLLARSGRREEAVAWLEAWLEASDGDPLADPAARVMARLDLAQLSLLEGDVKGALYILEELAGEPWERGRRLLVLAAVEQARGNPELALEAARAAEPSSPGDPLPLVQQAVLAEEWLRDPDEARAAWQRVLELARERGDLAGLILSMRARVALERSPERGAAAGAGARVEEAGGATRLRQR